jgi:hypothetical protein
VRRRDVPAGKRNAGDHRAASKRWRFVVQVSKHANPQTTSARCSSKCRNTQNESRQSGYVLIGSRSRKATSRSSSRTTRASTRAAANRTCSSCSSLTSPWSGAVKMVPPCQRSAAVRALGGRRLAAVALRLGKSPRQTARAGINEWRASSGGSPLRRILWPRGPPGPMASAPRSDRAQRSGFPGSGPAMFQCPAVRSDI